jgi:hypothetical protein
MITPTEAAGPADLAVLCASIDALLIRDYVKGQKVTVGLVGQSPKTLAQLQVEYTAVGWTVTQAGGSLIFEGP